MSLREVFIDFHGSERGFLSFGQNFMGRKVNVRQPEISIRQSAVSQRVVGIHRDGLFEILDGPQHRFSAVLVPKETASQIETVSFTVIRVPFSKTYLVTTRQLEFQ